MPLVRTIDERYMSFQIGMSHLTGRETSDGSKANGLLFPRHAQLRG